MLAKQKQMQLASHVMVSLLKRLQPFAIDLMLIDFAVLDLVMKER